MSAVTAENREVLHMSVIFYTPCATPRPVRLSEATRRFADESLHGRYGDDALRTPAVLL